MIRVATVADLQDVFNLVEQVGRLHAENRSDLFLENAITANKEKIEKRINDDKYHVLVSEQDGLVVGIIMAYCKQIQDDIKFKDAKILRIEEIVVDEKYRKNGHAIKLIEQMKKYAYEIGCNRIESNVWGFNKPSESCFKKCGFSIQQSILEYSLKNDEKNVELLYADSNEELQRTASAKKRIEVINSKRFLFDSISVDDVVLDCACGTGEYAVALAERGNKVFASDLSEANVEYIKNVISNKSISIDVANCNVMNLSIYSKQQFDAIICMGPAYHLNSNDFKHSLTEMLKVLKPNGKIIFSYLNKYFWAPYILANNNIYSYADIMDMQKNNRFSNGFNNFIGCAYFYSPAEIEDTLNSISNLSIEKHISIDGNWSIAHEQLRTMSNEETQELADYIYSQSQSDVDQLYLGKNNFVLIKKENSID